MCEFLQLHAHLHWYPATREGLKILDCRCCRQRVAGPPPAASVRGVPTTRASLALALNRLHRRWPHPRCCRRSMRGRPTRCFTNLRSRGRGGSGMVYGAWERQLGLEIDGKVPHVPSLLPTRAVPQPSESQQRWRHGGQLVVSQRFHSGHRMGPRDARSRQRTPTMDRLRGKRSAHSQPRVNAACSKEPLSTSKILTAW